VRVPCDWGMRAHIVTKLRQEPSIGFQTLAQHSALGRCGIMPRRGLDRLERLRSRSTRWGKSEAKIDCI